MRWRVAAASIVVLLGLGAHASSAEDIRTPKPARPAGAAQLKSKPLAQTKERTPAQPSQLPVVMPDAEKIVLLVRNTLITLNDAIQTGNFTVLRDRAAPGFGEANSPARLSQIFAKIGSRGVDLSVVSVITPQLTEAPTLDQKERMLRLKGYFPGQPVQINFDLLYQAVGGRWRLFGISVNLSQTRPSASKN